MSNDINVQIKLLADQAQKTLQLFEKNLAQTSKGLEDVKKATDQAGNSFKLFGANLAANLASGLITKFTSSLTSGLSAIIQGGRNAQNELDRLNLALASVGKFSADTSARFVELSDKIEQTTIFADGLAQENIALLATQTNLNEDGIERSILAATELASVYNLDLNQATQLLTQAYNGKTRALESLGITFVKTGTRAGDYEQILRQIETQQGAAAAKVNTFEGALQQANNAFDATVDELGKVIVTSPLVVNGLKLITETMQSLIIVIQNSTKWIQENSDVLQAFGVAVLAGSAALVAISAKAAIATVGFSGLATAAAAAWAAISAPATLIVGGFALVSGALFLIYKRWNDIKAATLDALAASLEFAAKGLAALGQSSNAKSLTSQANRYREIAQAAREAGRAEIETAQQTTAALEVENNKKFRYVSEEEQLRQQQLNNYAQNLARQQEDFKAANARELEDLRLHYERKNLVEEELEFVNLEAKLQRERDYAAQQQILLDQQLQTELDRINQATISEQDKAAAKLTLQQKYNQDTLKLSNDLIRKEREIKIKQIQQERQMNEMRIQATSQVFGAMAQIAQLGGAKSFKAYKALALAEATTAGYLAVSRAAAAPPGWPLNAPAVIAIGAQTAANVARIASMQAPKFQDGGIVPGSSLSGDRVLARVNSGEMILNRQQQSNLFNMVNAGAIGGGETVHNITVELDGEVVGRAVSRQVANGLRLGEVQ